MLIMFDEKTEIEKFPFGYEIMPSVVTCCGETIQINFWGKVERENPVRLQ
jgi:hypothetical protein